MYNLKIMNFIYTYICRLFFFNATFDVFFPFTAVLSSFYLYIHMKATLLPERFIWFQSCNQQTPNACSVQQSMESSGGSCCVNTSPRVNSGRADWWRLTSDFWVARCAAPGARSECSSHTFTQVTHWHCERNRFREAFNASKCKNNSPNTQIVQETWWLGARIKVENSQ